MKLLELEITKYRQIVNQRYDFSPPGPFDAIYRKLYGPLSVTVLVGVNGSGKTTLLSFLAQIFHNLERFHNRIPSDFRLRYENAGQEVLLSKSDGMIYIEAPGLLPCSVLDQHNPKTKARRHAEGHVSFAEVVHLLPRVIVSAFSVHGEYPSNRTSYIGETLVRIYDTSAVYGKNHYKLPSLSRGISRLVTLLRNRAPHADHLQSLLGIRFTGQVRIRDRVEHERDLFQIVEAERDRPPDEAGNILLYDKSRSDRATKRRFDQAVEVTDEILRRAAQDEVYINDILFDRDGRVLSLQNMSAGEKMLFIRLLSILSSIEENTIVLVEEPELHLDPAWTKQIITILQAFFQEYGAHFIVSTHSYAFINAVFSNNVLVLKRDAGASPPSFNTFLAGEAEISARLFRSFRVPNYLEHYVRELVANGDPEQLRVILDALGESHIRFEVFRRLTMTAHEGGAGSVEGHQR